MLGSNFIVTILLQKVKNTESLNIILISNIITSSRAIYTFDFDQLLSLL